MKKFLFTMFLLICLGLTLYYHDEITTYIIENYIYTKEVILENPNIYKKNDDYLYVQNTDNYYPKNKQDILNIIYTSLNSGYDSFYYFCDDDYADCIIDSKKIVNDQMLLSNINNFVHPYNSFSKLYVEMNNIGRITINVEKLYTDEKINIINQKIDLIYKEIIDESMSNQDKIKVFHDYVINNAQYDTERNDFYNKYNTYKYESNTAYGTLIEGYAICGGYSDTMAIFLNKIGINNYKVASQKHVWNVVNVDNKWLHLDLTWDDPVLESGQSILNHYFFLITSNNLKEKNTGEHIYDTNVYLELE